MASPTEKNVPHFVTKASPPPQFSNYPTSVQPFMNPLQQTQPMSAQQPMFSQHQPMFPQQQPVFSQQLPQQQPMYPMQQQPSFVQQPQPMFPQHQPPLQSMRSMSLDFQQQSRPQPMRSMSLDPAQQPPMQQIHSPQPIFNPQQQSYPVITQQPMPTMSMACTPGGGNRNARNKPMMQDGRDWSSDLFACEDSGACILAWCFPSLVYGKNKSRLEHLNTKGYPHPQQGDICNSDCMLHYCLFCFGCACLLQIETRGQIRNRYNIRGDSGSDFFVAWCCTPCEMAQESQELALEEQSFNHPIQ